jgi:hypothetical protein
MNDDQESKLEEPLHGAHLRLELDRIIDDAGHDSFPASDAPTWWAAPPKVVIRRTAGH